MVLPCYQLRLCRANNIRNGSSALNEHALLRRVLLVNNLLMLVVPCLDTLGQKCCDTQVLVKLCVFNTLPPPWGLAKPHLSGFYGHANCFSLFL